MASNKTFDLTPEQGYDLVLAALNIVSGPSPAVHKRCRRAVEAGKATASPTVQARDLVALVDVLNGIRPPDFADKVIALSYDDRREAQRRQRS